jgi:general secretion pathway protein D
VEKLAAERTADKAPVAAGGSGSSGASVATLAKVTVQADEQTNALIITAKPDIFRDMQTVIRKLDIRRAQVLVEALIVELNQDKAADFGVQWIAVQNDIGLDTSDFITAPQALTSGTLVGAITSGDFTFGVLARALDQDADANIVSTPSLLTLDNEEAEIIVGREVPFVTGSYTSTGDSTNPNNPFQTIQRENVGLTLKITPQINEGNAIRLSIDQEISNLLPGAAQIVGTSDVITSVRSINTNVIVDDGAILVLGGLIDDVVNESESRIPIIGDIPLLGEAFTYREVDTQKRNLMIFIRPTILRDSVANLGATETKYNDLRDKQVERYGRGVKLLRESDQPVLPPLDAQGVPLDGPNPLPGEVKTEEKPARAESEFDVHDNYDI